MTPIGPTSGRARIGLYHFFFACRSDSCLCGCCVVEEFIFFKLKLNKKRIAEAILHKINYLSIPAKAATEDALDLSTKPGPDGMLAPGRSPAPVLYKCNTIIGT